MKWRKLNDYAIRSHCGRWQISHSVHGDRHPPGHLYSVWRRNPHDPEAPLIYLYAYESAGAAKQAARDEQERLDAALTPEERALLAACGAPLEGAE